MHCPQIGHLSGHDLPLGVDSFRVALPDATTNVMHSRECALSHAEAGSEQTLQAFSRPDVRGEAECYRWRARLFASSSCSLRMLRPLRRLVDRE